LPLGAVQLIGRVRGVMMNAAAPRGVPVAVLDGVAGRSVEWLIMGEDLPAPESRVTVDGGGMIRTARVARDARSPRPCAASSS
jgi:hypothetical protein